MTKEEKPLDLSVSFSGVAIGDEQSSVGCKVSRSRLPYAKAVQTFVGKRLGVILRTTPNGGEDAAQTHEPDDAFEKIEGHADVKRIGIGPKEIGFRLTFSNGEVSPHDLADIAQREGMLTVESVEDIPEPEPKGEEHASRNGLPKPNTTGKDELIGQPIAALVKYGITEAAVGKVVDAVGGDTIGHLEQFMRTHLNDWTKKMKGLGQASTDRLAEALRKARYESPMPEKSLFNKETPA